MRVFILLLLGDGWEECEVLLCGCMCDWVEVKAGMGVRCCFRGECCSVWDMPEFACRKE